MENASHPLLSLPEDRLGAYYEERVLALFGWDATTAPLGELASAYRGLSAALISSAGAGPSGGVSVRSGGVTEDHVMAVRMLLYGFRTVLVARRLLRTFPPEEERLVELGSGVGPFALVAAASKLSTTLVDADASVLERASGFFDAFGLKAPTTRREELLAACDLPGALAAPYSVLEWSGDDHRREAAFAKRTAGRQVYLVERGTKEGGHFVQRLRDAVPESVRAPCPPRPTCSFAERPRDWCHFTWGLEPGPLTRRIADKAQRRWQQMHVAFLVLGGPAVEGERVLSVQGEGRQKVVVTVCGVEGAERLVALRRNRALYDSMSGLEAATLLSSSARRGEARGDGIRVEDSGDLVIIERLGLGAADL